MYTVQYRRPFPPADLSESKMWWCGDDSWIAANKITEILCQPHVWRDNVICKVGHFAIALRAYCIVYTNEKTWKSNKADEIMCSTACLPPPSEDLGTKSDCSPEGSSHRDFHKNYPSMESSITLLPALTFILSNHCVWESWLTHSSYLYRLLKREISDFFSLTLCCNSLGCFT